MRIGVVCEGPSDFPAISHFIGNLLAARGNHPVFVPLFPQMDRTRPEGGWANVLLWLNNNPPETRVQRYFAGGLFGGALSTEPLDAIILQLDADVIEDQGFRKFVSDNYEYIVDIDQVPAGRANQICNVLLSAAKFDEMANADRDRHVLVPAVESTETWCVAAFHAQPDDFEMLRGAALVNAFMKALEQSEGRMPQDQYANVDKDVVRRDKFCEKHSGGAARIVVACEQFAASFGKLSTVPSLT